MHRSFILFYSLIILVFTFHSIYANDSVNRLTTSEDSVDISTDEQSNSKPLTWRERAHQDALNGKVKRLQEAIKDKPWLRVVVKNGEAEIEVVDQNAYEEAKKLEQEKHKLTSTQSAPTYTTQSGNKGMGPSERIVKMLRVDSISDFLRLIVIICIAIGILMFVDSFRKRK